MTTTQEAGSPERKPATLIVSVSEAYRLLGISRATFYELLAQGHIRTLKVGSRRLVPVAELHRFIEARLAQESKSA